MLKMKIKFFCLIFCISLMLHFTESQQENAASQLLRQDICPGSTAQLSCQPSKDTNFTVVVTEALYGIKAIERDLCEYADGDCYAAALLKFCNSPSDSCSITASNNLKVPNCQNQIAEYMHVRYRCIPLASNVIKAYNVCNDTSVTITDEAAFISSPSYPTYVSVPNECTRKIVVPNDKLINIWIATDMKEPDTFTNVCLNDYVKITDSTGTYSACDYRKYAFESRFCSSTIYVSYKAPAILGLAFRGFRLYYETVDRSTQPDCSTATPPSPTTPAVTTTSTKPPPLIDDLVATGLIKITACKGEEKTINIPRNYLLVPINVYYGVTSDFTCNSIGPQNCRSPASLTCNTPDSCTISLNTNVALADCGNKIANYIGAEYRLIPTVSTRNITLCDGNHLNATIFNAGVITSPNYPNYQASGVCGKVIVAPQNRQIRVFLNDLSIAQPVDDLCMYGYLVIDTGCDYFKYCGDSSNIDSKIFTSCTNELTIAYVAVGDNDPEYRGFNIYYETITPDSSIEMTASACARSSVNMKCDPNPTTNFTVYFGEAIYGIKSLSTNQCEYNDGDCFQPLTTTPGCVTLDFSCSISSTAQTLSNCQNQRADYLFARYKCIPSFSTIIKDFNICDRTLTDITDYNGFISSPNFPFYTSVNTECVQRIVAPSNKIIKMWIFVDIKFDSTICSNDYVKITDTTGTYKECSYRKVSYDKQLCSSVVYVSYYAPSILSSSSYKGFRIYYEFADRSTQPDCITGTPGSPTSEKPTSTTPQLVFDLAATNISTTIVCRGTETTIDIPNRYILFPIDVFYGVTANQQCKNASLQDCRSPAQLLCSFDNKCTVSLYNDIVLPDCGGKIADYIGIEYRFIPPVTTRNVSICDASDLNLTSSSYGVMTNPNYPLFEPNKNCARTVLAPLGKVVRVYITDYYIGEQGINGECNNGYLELKSSCETRRYCGAKSNTGSYIFMSCTNFLSISYVSGSSSVDYRGFNIYYDVVVADMASSLRSNDTCAGDYVSYNCEPSENTKFTPYIVEGFFGKKQTNSTKRCEYTQGDCVDKFSTEYCSSSYYTCGFYVPYYTILPECGKEYADYFHSRYKCIPTSSTKIRQYDICKDSPIDITDTNAFLQSPLFPQTFVWVPNECTRRIVAPNDKLIKAWVYMDLKDVSDNNCPNDYLKITDNTGTYTACGLRKYSFENQLCSSVIYVSYKAATNISSIYKGFQLYYEFVDRSTQPDCPTGTPISPTTPTITTTTPQVVFDLAASPLYRSYACLGNQTTFQTPANYKLFPLSVYYGVTKSGQCRNISIQDCRSPAQLNCPLEGSCTISLYNDVPVPDCSQGSSDNVKANYIGIDYRFIPFVSSKNFTVCDTSVINANFSRYGIITNPNYPKWEPNNDCKRKVIAENGKIIRVYLNDFNIEQPNNNGSCDTGYVTLRSDCSTVKYCGQKSVTGDYVFETCTNLLEISYVSSQFANNDYRGFNLYYEATLTDGVSKVLTKQICAGTSDSVPCDPSINTNFTAFVSEALYGVKPSTTPSNETCLFDSNDCFGTYTSACTTPGIMNCNVYVSAHNTLQNCNNMLIDYLNVKYKCLPFSSSTIFTYNICDQSLSELTSSNGFITSPNYPTYQSVNGECQLKITAPSNKIVKIWILEVDILSDSSNQCPTNYIMITDNTGSYRICGFKKVSYENELCSSVVYINYRAPSLGGSSYKGFKLYYEFLDRNSQPSCSSSIPERPPTAPAATTTTTTTTSRPLVNNLAATVILKTYVCKGETTNIQIPVDYQLFPINVYYGVTSNGTCRALSQQDCRSPAQLLCSIQGSCQVSLLSDISLEDCGGKVADYLSVEYRFIPIVSTRNTTMCSENSNLILNATSAGIITSPGYPNYQTGINCNKTLVAPPGKIIRVHVNDVFLEQPNEFDNCDNGYLSLKTDCRSVDYCGEKSSLNSFIFTTCGNTLEIAYVSSNNDNIYRGFNLYYEVTTTDRVTSRLTKDICSGSSATINCDTSINTNFTIIINEVLSGIKSSASNKCEYNEGDCYALSTSTYCTTTSDSCSIYANSASVSKCDDKNQDYLHVRYRCVPYTSNVIREYNVCDRSRGDVVDDKGFISSPSYPTFVTVDQECTVKIKAPLNKIINVWLPDVYIKSPEPNNDCVTDYIKIVHGTGTLKACGNKKYQFDNRICSSEVFINYKAPNRTSGFKGFKLYYEFADRSTQPNCPTDAPTTTLSTPSRFPETTTKHLIQDLMASEIKHEYICKGEKKTIEVPNDFLIFPINYYYGVSSDSKCTSISDKDCKSPLPFTYLTDSNIEISFYNDIALTEDCSGADATYIGLEYRFIPRITSQNYSVCDNHELKLKDSQYGVITSPNYPNWVPNERCMMRLVAPQNKIIRVYINDLNTEIADENGECSSTHLSLMSGNNIPTRYCGDKSQYGDYVYLSCSETLEVYYRSSSIVSENYRGFHLYFEVIDKNNVSCGNVTMAPFTRTTRTTRHITLFKDETHSSHLIGWSLGLGIPALIAFILIGIFIMKRKGFIGFKSEETNIRFSQLKNSSDNSNFYS